MVVYRHTSSLSSTNYWQVHQSVNDNHRHQRNLLLYSTCSVDELLKFCIDRDLQVPCSERNRRLMTRERTTELLEQADEDFTFRLLDLPAEMRNNIYTLYCDGFSEVAFPAQPPLAVVSRQVRHEFLPIFYDMCKFSAALHWDFDHGSEFTKPAVARFFELASQTMLQRIKKLHITGNVYIFHPSASGVTSSSFVLGGQGTEQQPTIEAPDLSRTMVPGVRDMQPVAKRFRLVMQHRIGKLLRGEKLKLEAGDGQRIRKLFNTMIHELHENWDVEKEVFVWQRDDKD